MTKGGQLVYKALVTLVLSALIVFSFMSAGKAFGSGEPYFKKAVAEDLALLLGQMQMLPGDVTIRYPEDLTDFAIRVEGNEVLVFNAADGPLDPTRRTASFMGYPMTHQQVSRPDPLTITKQGEIILYSGDHALE